MLRFLLFFFLVGGVLEIASVIWMGGTIGLLPTLLLLFCSGAAGIWLLRSAGANAADVIRSSLRDGRRYELSAGKAVVRILAAILLLLPGFFSDAVAFLVLLLPVNWWTAKLAASSAGAGSPNSGAVDPFGRVIEGEAVEITGAIDLKSPDKGSR